MGGPAGQVWRALRRGPVDAQDSGVTFRDRTAMGLPGVTVTGRRRVAWGNAARGGTGADWAGQDVGNFAYVLSNFVYDRVG